MEIKQFKSGFILDHLLDTFQDGSEQQNNAAQLCYWLSHFDAHSKNNFLSAPATYLPHQAVIVNMLQRGLPTRLNIKALEMIVEASPLLQWNNSGHSICTKWANGVNQNLQQTIFRALHVIDSRINRNSGLDSYHQSWERLDSQFEEAFYYNSFPEAIGQGGDFIIQLLATQRKISNIIGDKIPQHTLQERVRRNFEEQRTDFSIEFPYKNEHQLSGVVIEVDGSQHNNNEQLYLDTERDKAVALSGWYNTVRLKTSDFNTNSFSSKVRNLIIPSLNVEYIEHLKQNYTNSLLAATNTREILAHTLTPFAIARFQRIFIEAMVHGKLSVSASQWNIAVIERDVPCAFIALEDLKASIHNYNELTEDKFILPQINLEVFSTPEFISCSLHCSGSPKHLQAFNGKIQYDLLLDISVLQRTMPANVVNTASKEVIVIRSAHYINSKLKTATAALIKYHPFAKKTLEEKWIVNNEIKGNLQFFLQSVFRKKDFREGQLPIIHNALQCRSVIGLLPTGGGKSLTYQFSALLQPGISIVIDPIRSLMKDQVDGLRRNMIDSCVFINSTQQGEAKRKAMRKMAEGEAQFVFVSPERLQMEEFRNMLHDMFEQHIYFSYCIVDEAHCVSEWGHDFRTAYLRLGENAMRFCKTANLDTLPIFGLTATASYDVLADVQRELSGDDESKRLDEDAIVRSEFTKRDELQFVVEEVTFPAANINSIWDLKKELGSKKQERVKALLEDIPEKLSHMMQDPLTVFDEEEWSLAPEEKQSAFQNMCIEEYVPHSFYEKSFGALVFCPHTKGNYGVTDKYKVGKDGAPVVREGYFDILSNRPSIKAGYFMGSGSDEEGTGKLIQEASFQNQDDFIKSKLNLMVATKAFGMGIDKENIRYTIHVNYPGSIESYVQEAGRAGRDRKLALSYILFNDQSTKVKGEDIDHDLEVNMYFHRNSFKGTGKELAVLDELLTEIYFPDRTFELENIISQQLEVDVKCNYWERENLKRLYIGFSFNEKLGYFDLNGLYGVNDNTINPELSQRIFGVIKNHIDALNLTEPAYLWIQRSDKQIGIEKLIEAKRTGERFSLTVGFYNNVKERVKTITKWLQKVVHNNFNEATVQKIRASCTDADAFIEEVEDHYLKFTGNKLNFEQLCKQRDVAKGNPSGTAYRMFFDLYNGYRDKMDTEKAIYRLSTLGIIDDYTVNFSANTFTLFGIKKTDKQYKDCLKQYLLKYYSEKSTIAKLKGLNSIDEDTTIRKCLHFLVRFVYKEIQKKRQLAIHDMKTACRLGLEKGSIELKNFIDLYFNSKYARSGYSYTNDAGKEISASLPDLTNYGKEDDLKLVWQFIEIVEEDPKAGQIDNIKHLRGACARMLSNQPDSYTLLLLNAFTLYMLEFKNSRFLLEAEGLLQEAFSNISDKEPGMNDKKLEKIFDDFVAKLKEKNLELDHYMEKHGFVFDFSSIMIKRLLKPIKLATSTLRSLNQILD